MTDRFCRAARDGILPQLKEATRKDCNERDSEGMTPTLWSVFEGNYDALRVLIARGGDPEKCDYYGNTALHYAAARGYMNCVDLLLHYGVNIYAKDIDHHTAKDLAAMNNHDDILRCLDEQAAKETHKNPRRVRTLQEKATKEANKLVKKFQNVEEKARKMAEKEQKRLDKERRRMEQSGHSAPATSIPRASMSALHLRKDSRAIYAQSTKFSDLVNQDGGSGQRKKPVSSIYKKITQQKLAAATAPSNKGSLVGADADQAGDFKISSIVDGKRSISSISGLRRDSEVAFVGKFNHSDGKPELSEIFNGKMIISKSGGSAAPAQSQPDILIADGIYPDEKVDVCQQQRVSIFERPGLGNFVFRNSLAALADSTKAAVEDSIGSAGSLKQRKPAYDDEFDSDSDEEETKTPMHFFLAAVGLEDFVELFVKDKFDLDSLMLVQESDLVAMGIPRGYRLKLMHAIAERRANMEDPGELEECHL